MKKAKINYSEGDIISIPLQDNSGRFARGIVARLDGKGGVFGYFFQPIDEKLDVDTNIQPSKAMLVGLFGDLGLIKNQWKVIGKVNPWHRDEWPLPPLLRIDKIDKVAYLTEYDQETLRFGPERKFNLDEINPADYYEDGVMGSGFVEKRLTRLINEKEKTKYGVDSK